MCLKIYVKNNLLAGIYSSDMELFRILVKAEASQVVLVVMNLPANAEVIDSGLISVSGTSPGEGNGNPLQYSCLENPMDRVSWRAIVHRFAGVGND